MKKITGEVVDMACYIDHNATGEKHADCAKKCITSGLPVGLKADDGKTYLLIGEHKPLNSELAEYAARKITVEGKVASRDGIYMIENAVIQKMSRHLFLLLAFFVMAVRGPALIDRAGSVTFVCDASRRRNTPASCTRK